MPRTFYERGMGWSIAAAPWPDWLYVAIEGVQTGGLAKRRSLLGAERMNTFELTLSVDDVVAALATAESLGARALMRTKTSSPIFPRRCT
jgi:predicted enzyme related to lactoylglutathione lyase